ncbi:MAG TPA: histidine phosphatase family protein, partial [Acidimicrobiales bacterium]|nr:histidine phosphatase family protein [Acidimicrobiales bacterium]
MATRILLLRHGQSTWNAEGRWQGWSDPPLSQLGRAQAAEAARRLDGLGLTSVTASDLDRARTTASAVAAALDLAPVTVDPDLREYNVGDWEGLTRPEIERRWPDQMDDWRKGRLIATPGGETRVAFLARVTAGLARLVASEDAGACPLVITHGGVIRAVEQAAGGERSAVIDNLAGRWFTVDADQALRA